ncbi:MAG: type IV pilus assembly protein PilP [Cellvibrionaceae bacterium]|jgi:type IV pilus assembly protein PilP
MMKAPTTILSLILLSTVSLSGCSGSSSHQDLQDFIAENKRRPPGRIKEAPKIQSYNAYDYDAYQLRSPFDRPVEIRPFISERDNQRIKPDPKRLKERLEQYDLNSLSMVGTLSKDGVVWALVSDPDGSIERIQPGNYMGRNHGKVVNLADNKLDLIEIVASGEGWLERPNVLELKTVDPQ